VSLNKFVKDKQETSLFQYVPNSNANKGNSDARKMKKIMKKKEIMMQRK